MKIFLVRHGTTKNSKEKWQTPKSPLSELGQRQANLLSLRSRFKKVDIVISSPWPRAKNTAEIVTNYLDKPLEIAKIIHERKQHNKIYGSVRSSKISQDYHREAINNIKDLDWKFKSDEESIRDVIKRGIKFKNGLIANNSEQSVLVVSHDIFIRCLITVCILGDNYKDKPWIKLFYSIRISHTGISLMEYINTRKQWRTWYLNDFSHLKNLQQKKRLNSFPQPFFINIIHYSLVSTQCKF